MTLVATQTYPHSSGVFRSIHCCRCANEARCKCPQKKTEREVGSCWVVVSAEMQAEQSTGTSHFMPTLIAFWPEKVRQQYRRMGSKQKNINISSNTL